jgi:hypothetical protein
MKLGNIRWIVLAIVLGASFFAAPPLASREQPPDKPKVDLGSFTKEIMVLKMGGGQRQLAMWFPFEYFVEANLTDPEKTRAKVEKEIAFLAPYHVVIVQCSRDKDDGSSEYQSLKELRARAVLKTGDGEEIAPLDKSPPLVSATVEAIKGGLSAEGSEAVANMHVLLFPAAKDGKSIVDTSKKGKFTLVLKADKRFGETEFVWHTPFDATHPVPPCPKCKEAVSAKWDYCPWCGASLEKK